MSDPKEELPPVSELTDAELEEVSGGMFDTHLLPDPQPPNPPPGPPPPPLLKI